MTKYFVSVAGAMPVNFEYTIYAKNEKEAFKKWQKTSKSEAQILDNIEAEAVEDKIASIDRPRLFH